MTQPITTKSKIVAVSVPENVVIEVAGMELMIRKRKGKSYMLILKCPEDTYVKRTDRTDVSKEGLKVKE